MARKVAGLVIHDAQNNELMNVRRVEREGNHLVIRGNIFGAMPMVAKLSPEEARKAFKVMDLRTALFIVSMLFRRSR